MKKAILERRVSIFDVTTPYAFTEKRYEKYLEELSKHSFIEDHTARGEFVYGRSGYAKNIRVEVDSRFKTDVEVEVILNNIFSKVK